MNAFSKEPVAKHTASSWLEDASVTKPMFRNVVTLDPILAGEVWTTLSVYTPAVELSELTRRLHMSLVRALSNKTITLE